MPIYEYDCETCGPFEALRPMSSFSEPCECPECNQPAPRVMLSAPNISIVSSSIRRANETNERSANSPKKLSSHGPGCSCCSGGGKKSSGTLYRADGSKSFPKKRPWMISH